MGKVEQITLEQFQALLSKHDWYYDFSDDARVYDAGRKNEAELSALAQELGPEFEREYKREYAKHFNLPIFKKGN